MIRRSAALVQNSDRPWPFRFCFGRVNGVIGVYSHREFIGSEIVRVTAAV